MKIDVRIEGPNEKCSTLVKLKIKPRFWKKNLVLIPFQGSRFCYVFFFLCFHFILFMVFGFCTFFIFNICIHICGDYLVCFHTNVPHGWLFFMWRFIVYSFKVINFVFILVVIIFLKLNFLYLVFHDGGDDVYGDNDGVYNFRFFVGF